MARDGGSTALTTSMPTGSAPNDWRPLGATLDQPIIKQTAISRQNEQRLAWASPILILGGASLGFFDGSGLEFLIALSVLAVVPFISHKLEIGIVADETEQFSRSHGARNATFINLITAACLVLSATVAPVWLMLAVLLVPLASLFAFEYDDKGWLRAVGADRNLLMYATALPSVIAGLALLQVAGADIFGTAVHTDSVVPTAILAAFMLAMAVAIAFRYTVEIDRLGASASEGHKPYEKALQQGLHAKRAFMVCSFALSGLLLAAGATLAGMGMVDHMHEAMAMLTLLVCLNIIMGVMLGNGIGNAVTSEYSQAGEKSDLGPWEVFLYFLSASQLPYDPEYGKSVAPAPIAAPAPSSSTSAAVSEAHESDKRSLSPGDYAAQMGKVGTQAEQTLEERFGAKNSEAWNAARNAALNKNFQEWLGEMKFDPSAAVGGSEALDYLDLSALPGDDERTLVIFYRRDSQEYADAVRAAQQQSHTGGGGDQQQQRYH